MAGFEPAVFVSFCRWARARVFRSSSSDQVDIDKKRGPRESHKPFKIFPDALPLGYADAWQRREESNLPHIGIP
jgi:hypothetical protein